MPAPTRILTAFTLSVLTVACVAGARGQTPAVPCEAGAEVREAIRNLPLDRTERVAAARALIDRFPNDLFAHTACQDTLRFEDPNALISEYQRLLDKHPSDSLFTYLATRARIGKNTKGVISEFAKQLADRPQFPWPHLDLAQIYRYVAFKDPQKFQEHVLAFLQVCPSSLQGLAQLRHLEPSDYVRQAAGRLREMLQSRSDPDAAQGWPTLWSLEFRARPAGEYDQLRRQVAADAKRLRSLAPAGSREFLLALREGYTLAGDNENLKWAEEQLKKTIPPLSGFSTAYQEWRDKNPYPQPRDPPEKRSAYNKSLLEATSEWVRRWPNELVAWMERLSALQMAKDVPSADVQACGEAILRLKDKPGFYTSTSPSVRVAMLYADKGVATDQIPRLIRQGIEEQEKLGLLGNEFDFVRPPGSQDVDKARATGRFYAFRVISEFALRMKQADLAREALQRQQQALEKSKPGGNADPKSLPKLQSAYAFSQRQQYELLARLAELEGRKMDALTFYQNAILVYPATSAAPNFNDLLISKARALWKELGGTGEGWQAWLARKEELAAGPPPAATSPPATRTGPMVEWTRKLPDFELTDISGKTWRLADFRGKTTFINFWASW